MTTTTKSTITATDLKAALSIIEVQPNMEEKLLGKSTEDDDLRSTKGDKTPKIVYTERDLSRLSRGWECIINNKEYLRMCMEHTKQEGQGMSIFSFLPKEKITETQNCEYHYVERGASAWNLIMDAFRQSTSLENYITVDGYDPTVSFLVCIVSPTDDGGTLQRIDVVPFSNV